MAEAARDQVSRHYCRYNYFYCYRYYHNYSILFTIILIYSNNLSISVVIYSISNSGITVVVFATQKKRAQQASEFLRPARQIFSRVAFFPGGQGVISFCLFVPSVYVRRPSGGGVCVGPVMFFSHISLSCININVNINITMVELQNGQYFARIQARLDRTTGRRHSAMGCYVDIARCACYSVSPLSVVFSVFFEPCNGLARVKGRMQADCCALGR